MKMINFIQLLFLGMTVLFVSDIKADRKLPTYFQYSQSEIERLSEKKSDARMSNSELMKWDEIALGLSQQNPKAEISRMYAYLYTAQKEAAFLSYNSHGQYMGSLDPISGIVLKLFFPAVPNVESDEYSDRLAKIVFAKIKERFDEEAAQIRDFPLAASDSKLKNFPKPFVGLKKASQKPWLLKEPLQFKVSPPPAQNDPYWVQEAEKVKKIVQDTTKEQLQAVKFWAKEAGPKSGSWVMMINDYLFSHDIVFAKILCVRAILSEAEVDVDIPLFYTKYLYLIKRPSIIDPEIKSHINFPNHPSFPSGHSTWSAACATILSHYFPKEKDHWFQVAEEVGNSRIWGGIHYPVDHQAGWDLGIQLGNEILRSPKICVFETFEERK